MKPIMNRAQLICVLIIIVLVGGLSSCKREEKMRQTALDMEYDAAYEAYKEIVHYVEGKKIRYNSYQELIHYSDAPSYVYEKIFSDAKMTHDAENRTLSFEANPESLRSGDRYMRGGTGKLDGFSFGIIDYVSAYHVSPYPICILARWDRARTLQIKCDSNPVTNSDWYVEFFLHENESTVSVRYEVDSPREFHSIISNAINKLPIERHTQLQESINSRYINTPMAQINNTDSAPIISRSKSSPLNSVQQSAESLNSEDSGKNMGVSGRYSIASDRLLTEKDVEGCSKKDIRLMRNAIFARHGYIFKNKELADYFSTMDWYEPRYSDVTSKLTEIELKNIEFLKKHE